MNKLMLFALVALTFTLAGTAHAGPPAEICRFLQDVVGVFVPVC